MAGTAKPKTWFIDIDGVVFEHRGPPSQQWALAPAELCDGVRDALDKLEARGDHVVLVTARPERLRYKTEDDLERLGVTYHQLVMGVTAGVRVIVNDAKADATEPTAQAITLPRNGGLTDDLDSMCRPRVRGSGHQDEGKRGADTQPQPGA